MNTSYRNWRAKLVDDRAETLRKARNFEKENQYVAAAREWVRLCLDDYEMSLFECFQYIDPLLQDLDLSFNHSSMKWEKVCEALCYTFESKQRQSD